MGKKYHLPWLKQGVLFLAEYSQDTCTVSKACLQDGKGGVYGFSESSADSSAESTLHYFFFIIPRSVVALS